MAKKSGETTQLGARVDSGVWEQFKDFVQNKHGKSSGVTSKEVEDALIRHMGQSELQHVDDRLRRIEDALDIDHPPRSDRPSGERDRPSDPSESDPKKDDLTPRTQTKVDNILGNLPGRFTSDQLDAAIQNVAGSSPKTLKKYRDILTNRHVVVKAPWVDDRDEDADGFYQDRRMFAVAAVQHMDAGALYQLQDNLGPYWGDNWVIDELPDDMPNPFDTVDDPDGSDEGRLGFQ